MHVDPKGGPVFWMEKRNRKHMHNTGNSVCQGRKELPSGVSGEQRAVLWVSAGVTMHCNQN